VRPGPFIVLGMGRSGTSYVGSLLAAKGIEMGSSLKPADAHNPGGYFEDVETTGMHERWLARRGLDLASLSDSFPLAGDPEERDAITAYVARRQEGRRRWGVKAPGILFFWSAWRAALPPMSVLLIPFRHPAAVPDSFERYGLERQRALDLWAQLNTLAIQAAAGPERVSGFRRSNATSARASLDARALPRPVSRHAEARAPLGSADL
jgi:hypothetical protein